jgi:putative ABC transport system permease protein
MRNFSHEQEANGPAPAESPSLDETAREQIEHLLNVQEAYPDIRFVSELRYEDKPHLTMVAGLTFSAKNNEAFDGMAGGFFSSPTAPEVILQKSFAEQLLGKSTRDDESVKVSDLAKPLLGKQLLMRYAERTAADSNGGQSTSSTAYSVISREQTLKIVGVCDLDPDSLRQQARARVFLPLEFAENLHVMQPSDLRDTTNVLGGKATYTTVEVRVKSPKYVQSVEDSIKKMGFNTFSIVDATKNLRQFFAVLDLFLGIFGSLALAVASIGIVNTLVMAILERRREIGIMKSIGASDVDVKGLFFTMPV